MKMFIFPIAILSSLAVSAQVAKGPSASGIAPGADPVISQATPPPASLNPNSVVYPWQTGAAFNPGRLSRLLTDLQEDIDTTLSGIREANQRPEAPPSVPPVAVVNSTTAMEATGYGQLPARDLSTLVSQDLSQNLAQNLSTSLAVPTCPPWSTWGNGPVMVLANIGGQEVGIPALPPRTAWGNGLGAVVTAPNGTVYTLVPGYRASNSQEAAAPSADLVRQPEIVQDDLTRVIRFLATLNTNNVVVPGATPGEPPVYLSPTGRK